MSSKSTAAVIMFIFTALISQPSYADATGIGLLKDCKGAIKLMEAGQAGNPDLNATFRSGYCLGLVSGVTELIDVWNYSGSYPAKLCLQDKVSNEQYIRIVTKYLEDNPEILNYGDVALIMRAVNKAFACPEE